MEEKLEEIVKLENKLKTLHKREFCDFFTIMKIIGGFGAVAALAGHIVSLIYNKIWMLYLLPIVGFASAGVMTMIGVSIHSLVIKILNKRTEKTEKKINSKLEELKKDLATEDLKGLENIVEVAKEEKANKKKLLKKLGKKLTKENVVTNEKVTVENSTEQTNQN